MKSYAFVLSAVLLAACGSPIVGAECRDGFTNCDGECVDLTRDPDHCGACEEGCGAFTCEESECTTNPRPNGDGDGDGDGDRDSGTGGTGGVGGRDAGESPIGTGNPFEPDAGFNFPDPGAGGCPIGTELCDGECVSTYNTRQHCGGCGIRCRSDEYCFEGMCIDRCDEPLRLCDGRCVDYQTDPFNCGKCGNICESGICEAGVCADALPGHVIVIGHDYRRADAPMQQRLAVNALFTQGRSPVRAILYRGTPNTDVALNLRARLRDTINQFLHDNDERTWEAIVANPSNLTSQLLDADVLLIPPQDVATDDRLLTLGRLWARSLVQFVARGGVIALFDTNSSNNIGTYQVLKPSGLFDADGVKRVSTPARMVVDLPGWGVAMGATKEGYIASNGTVSFKGVNTDGLVLVSSPAGDPVVIHWIVSR